MDFNIGIYGGCRGLVYTLLTVEPSGKVQLLSEDRIFGKGAGVPSGDLEISPTPTGFRVAAWDDEEDSVVCREYARVKAESLLRVAGQTRGECAR